MLTDKPQKLSREHFPYPLLFPKNLCLSKQTLTERHRLHTNAHTCCSLMNNAVEQALRIPHSFPCTVFTCYTRTAADTAHPHRHTCTCASSQTLSIKHTHHTQSHNHTDTLKVLLSPIFFCLWHCVSGKPGCDLTPPCFSPLLCPAPVVRLTCTHSHTDHSHESHTLLLCRVLLINGRNLNSSHSCPKTNARNIEHILRNFCQVLGLYFSVLWHKIFTTKKTFYCIFYFLFINRMGRKRLK